MTVKEERHARAECPRMTSSTDARAPIGGGARARPFRPSGLAGCASNRAARLGTRARGRDDARMRDRLRNQCVKIVSAPISTSRVALQCVCVRTGHCTLRANVSDVSTVNRSADLRCAEVKRFNVNGKVAGRLRAVAASLFALRVASNVLSIGIETRVSERSQKWPTPQCSIR